MTYILVYILPCSPKIRPRQNVGLISRKHGRIEVVLYTGRNWWWQLTLKSEWEFFRKSREKDMQAVGTVLSKDAEEQRGKERGEGVALVECWQPTALHGHGYCSERWGRVLEWSAWGQWSHGRNGSTLWMRQGRETIGPGTMGIVVVTAQAFFRCSSLCYFPHSLSFHNVLSPCWGKQPPPWLSRVQAHLMPARCHRNNRDFWGWLWVLRKRLSN